MAHPLTEKQYDAAMLECRKVFEAKLRDYGAAWRLMRPTSLTDQIMIKAERLRYLETSGEGAQVKDENEADGFIAIVNYGLVALIQLRLGFAPQKDMDFERAMDLYDEEAAQTRRLMLAKNNDYDEAWRRMRISSFTDLILMKIMRTKEIEDHGGHTEVSEGVAANYRDMIVYSIFGLIQIENRE